MYCYGEGVTEEVSVVLRKAPVQASSQLGKKEKARVTRAQFVPNPIRRESQRLEAGTGKTAPGRGSAAFLSVRDEMCEKNSGC